MSTKKDNKKGVFTLFAIIGLGWLLTRDKQQTPPGGSNDLPRGLRNNNIGNIKLNPANNWLGKIPADQNTDKVFEQFTAKKYGTRALIKLLKKYYLDYNLKTISQILAKWSPGSLAPGSTYVKFVTSAMQKGPNDLLTLQDLKPLTVYIAHFENGQPATNMQEVNAVVDEFNLQI
jgi:hypothetical protein